MEISRREFFRKMGTVGASLFAGGAILELVRCDSSTLNRQAARNGVRLAMAIDTVKCGSKPDCTSCISACHAFHNVPSVSDRKREIKWLWKDSFARVFPEYGNDYMRSEARNRKVMVTCNHCDNPPCARVCPVKATWKREDGIVMMDHHRCIGCRYCMAACPYGSRSFNWSDPRRFLSESSINREYPTRTRGVVEKCDLCAERVDRGQRPLCVEACSEGALLFGNIADENSEIRRIVSNRFALRRKVELGTNPEIYYLI